MNPETGELMRRLERAPLNGGVRLNVEEAAEILRLLRATPEAKHMAGPENTKRLTRPQYMKAARAR